MTKAHQIEIAVDADEAEQFAVWLNAQGHSATVGNNTANYVDGTPTTDEAANETMRALWDAYCKSA